MKTLKYKTNIKDGGCEDAVAPYLLRLEGITRWNVDTENPDKLLVVEAEDLLNDSLIVFAVREAGFQIEQIVNDEILDKRSWP